MTRTLLGIIAAFSIAVSTTAWSDDAEWPRVQSGGYQDMPDGQFVEIFARVEESCRQVLSARDKHIAELRKEHSERAARDVHDTLHFQCKGVLDSRMILARLHGYHMHVDESLEPAFWHHLDQARSNLK